jgi:hypothetical protein
MKVRESGEVVTLAGWRTKNPPGEYWEDGQDLELVGDWSEIPPERHGFHELWGMCWDSETLKTNHAADPIPEERNLRPHFVGPVMFVTDTQNNRVCKLEFSPVSHGVPAKVTEFLTNMQDPWDCVEWNNSLIVSERDGHRIAQYNMKTGEEERVILSGPALSHLNNSRWVIRDASLETIREQYVVGPEGLYVLDDWLYFGSMAMAQVKRVHLVTGEVQHVVNVRESSATGNKYVKITVSDGSFGPKGTVFVSQWINSAPIAYLPDGGRWDYVRYGVQYNTSIAVGNGRCVFGGSKEGIKEIRRL